MLNLARDLFVWYKNNPHTETDDSISERHKKDDRVKSSRVKSSYWQSRHATSLSFTFIMSQLSSAQTHTHTLTRSSEHTQSVIIWFEKHEKVESCIWFLDSNQSRLRRQWRAAKKEDRNQNRIPLMCFINNSQKGPGGYITTLIRVLMWSDETMMTMMRRLLALKLFEIRRHRFIRVLIELGERRMLP